MLFQSSKTTLPEINDLEKFFAGIKYKIKQAKDTSPEEYRKVIKETSDEIRQKILKPIMIRRTRKEIIEFYKKDLNNQGLVFPEVKAPERIVYRFNSKTSAIFEYTISLLKTFNYYRYTPLLFLKTSLSEFENQQQRNIHREKQIQGWSHAKKKALIEKNYNKLHELAVCKNESNFENFISATLNERDKALLNEQVD